MNTTKLLAPALLLSLTTNFGAYAGNSGGVTDGGVTAYRYQVDYRTIIFTDNPDHFPLENHGPLGNGVINLSGNSCNSLVYGADGVWGLTCVGGADEPVSTYICNPYDGSGWTPTSTRWCLFSENPRTGGKAWAVKYVDGQIPTNDGDSIVRCEATDTFENTIGCRPGKTEISIKDGYIKLDTTEGGPPPIIDCTLDTDHGRMIIDPVNDNLYICTAVGWVNR